MVNLTLTNGNAVLTITFAYIVVEQVTRQLNARKPQLQRLKLVPPKSRQRTRTTRKKLKQPSRLRRLRTALCLAVHTQRKSDSTLPPSPTPNPSIFLCPPTSLLLPLLPPSLTQDLLIVL